MFATKTIQLLSLLPSRPFEFYDRVMTVLETRLERFWLRPSSYHPLEWEKLVQGLEESLGTKIYEFLHESALANIESELTQAKQEILSKDIPFRLTHGADISLARLCYAVIRATKPAVVLETGVAYGVTSAFILKAMDVNGFGVLHSIDLPPLGQDADQFVGILIPKELKHRWMLYRGVSKRVLPQLLPHLAQVDVFIHDSLHTYWNMRREFQLIAPYLASRSIVISDDVEGNAAFHEWAVQSQPIFWAVTEEPEKKLLENEKLLGVSVFLVNR